MEESGQRPGNLIWIIALVAGTEALFQALEAAMDGRADKMWLWILAAGLLVVAAVIVENYKAAAGK